MPDSWKYIKNKILNKENIMEETVTISKAKWNKLVNADMLLGILQDYGVDNWSGYSEAMEEYEDALRDCAETEE